MRFTLIMLGFGILPGCCGWSEKVSVGVFDAGSGVPIVGAVVRVVYKTTWRDYASYMVPFVQCDIEEAATKDNGIAQVKVRGPGYQFYIYANEYGQPPDDVSVFGPGELPVRYFGGRKIVVAHLKHQNLPPRPPLT